MDNYKKFIKEGKFTLSGASESVQKVKELVESLDTWLRAVESTSTGTRKFIVTKAIKSAVSNTKKVAEAITNADKMEKKYKEES